MDHRAVRSRCEVTLRDLDVPEPFDGVLFSQLVAERRGRRVHLVPKETNVGPCGVWISLPSADYVFYEPATSRLHRDHIIVHELGHLLCDHIATDTIEDDVVRELMPHLDPDMVRRVIGRTTYTAVEEQEAEMIATLVLERTLHPVARRSTNTTPADAVLDRLTRTLGGR